MSKPKLDSQTRDNSLWLEVDAEYGTHDKHCKFSLTLLDIGLVEKGVYVQGYVSI